MNYNQSFRSLALFSLVTGTMNVTLAPPSDKIADIDKFSSLIELTHLRSSRNSYRSVPTVQKVAESSPFCLDL